MKCLSQTRVLRTAAAQSRAQTLKAVNPYDGAVAWEVRRWSAAEGMEALHGVNASFPEWKKTELSKREALLRACSDILNERAPEIAKVIATEMGKPVAQGEGEVRKCATVLDYYAEQMHTLLKDTHVALPGAKCSYISKQPLGTILLIMPWNFPFWQVFRQSAAALAAGNVIVCKHAPNVPKSAALIEDVFHAAADRVGVPKAIFANLPMYAEDISGILEHPSVRAVSLTGSSAAGKAVGAAAAKLLKPSVLELGGNDPSLVLEDADIERAARCGAAGRMLNAGQSCIGSKRFLVVDSVYDRFLEAFVEEMKAYEMGDPQDPATQLGPMVDHFARNKLHEQALATQANGASCVLGGELPDHKGAFYPPTVISDVQPGTPGWEDELFGPVASVIRVKDENQALEIANSSKYGLGASIYTADLQRGARLAAEIDTGMCFVNDFVKSSPLLPFGGVKESGYGRECGPYGIDSFCNIKSVVLA